MANPLEYPRYADPGNPLTAGQPTWADAADWHAQNLQDTLAAAQNPQTWLDAAHQYGNALLMGSVAPGIRAFHGSPYDFERFDASKIGTGEGAQAYGHGLYFAENEGVARGYRDRLTGSAGLIPGAPTGKQAYAVNGEYPPEGMSGHRAMDTAIDLNGMLNYMHQINLDKPDALGRTYADSYQGMVDYLKGNIERRIAAHRAEVGPDGPRGIAERDMHDLADYYDAHVRDAQPADVTPRPPGKMYEVNINADPAKMLDWDKPISEQSPDVQDALRQLGVPNIDKEHVTGKAAYMHLAGEAVGGGRAAPGSSQAKIIAAEKLRDAGLSGVSYLDQGSRGAPEGGTRNHVVFNDSTIEILRKYGIAGLIGGGAAAGAGTAEQ